MQRNYLRPLSNLHEKLRGALDPQKIFLDRAIRLFYFWEFGVLRSALASAHPGAQFSHCVSG